MSIIIGLAFRYIWSEIFGTNTIFLTVKLFANFDEYWKRYGVAIKEVNKV